MQTSSCLFSAILAYICALVCQWLDRVETTNDPWVYSFRRLHDRLLWDWWRLCQPCVLRIAWAVALCLRQICITRKCVVTLASHCIMRLFVSIVSIYFFKFSVLADEFIFNSFIDGIWAGLDVKPPSACCCCLAFGVEFWELLEDFSCDFWASLTFIRGFGAKYKRIR